MYLSPIDLLTVSNTEQDIIRCLVRKPQLTAKEIAKTTKIPMGELETVLKNLVSAARLVEHKVRGRSTTFSVQFEQKPAKPVQRNGTNLLDSLFG